MQNNLSQNILATICYYDVMDYPLTAFEIWKYLIGGQVVKIGNQEGDKMVLGDILDALEKEELKKQIETFRGYYFLAGRQNLVAQRIERNKLSQQKHKIIRRMVRFLRLVPFVRMISVAGRVAMKNAEKGSDLDLLIVIEKGRIFTGRFLVSGLLAILGKRRNGEKIKNKICLNHFLSTDFSLSVMDLFSSHEYVFMFPLFGSGYYRQFFEKNDWISSYRPNFKPGIIFQREELMGRLSEAIKQILENVCSFGLIESQLKKFQIAKIVANPKTQKAGGVIIYNDDELAFWPDFERQGPRVFETFKERMAELGKDAVA